MRALEHLARLVACDTQNPPRAMRAGDALFVYARDVLERAGFTVETKDLGAGAVSLFALRGQPQLVWNVHVDTVPAGEGWSGDPFALRLVDVDGEPRAIGRGACDVKGAAACLLAAVEETSGAAAILFSSDEEAGDGRCVKDFLATTRTTWRGAVVGEPTRGRAVLGHRGMATAEGTFRGTPGHASAARALTDSAVHELVRWAQRALDLAASEERVSVGGLAGVRLNLGVVEGGTKSNMIADRARVRFGVRSRPGESPVALAERVMALAPDASRVEWALGFVGPSLPASQDGVAAARALAAALDLPVGDPVDFWSEASLFSAAGIPALVYGPGDIAQAHAPDEWIATAALEGATATYRRIIQQGDRVFAAAVPVGA